MGRPGVGLERGGTGARLGPLAALAPGRRDPGWVAGIGNPVASVALGESDPKVEANGDSPEQGCSKVNGEAGVTNDERTNEHLKLVANWLNTLATGVIAAGVFVPAANEIFNILPSGTDFGLVVGIGAVCFVLGIALHLIGHLFLGGLR